MPRVKTIVCSLISLALLASAPMLAHAADWPTWRFDEGRTAASPHDLPQTLNHQWTRTFPERDPVWDDPLNRDLMPYDRIFEPIVLGTTLFLSFNDSDKIMAIDVATGKTLWTYYTDGPVRFPAIGTEGTILFVSDDGYLYCLDATSGKLVWRFRGGPSDRKLLGNKRLISTWPARGAPVLKEGVVYWAASIWPMMGTFIYALEAETGKLVWENDGTGALWTMQPHRNPAFAGVAPQGAFAIDGGSLLVPGGRSVPACFDLATGDYRYHLMSDGNRDISYDKTGGSFVCCSNGVFFNHYRDQITSVYQVDNGHMVADKVGRYPVLDRDTCYFSGSAVSACPFDEPLKSAKKWANSPSWKVEVDATGDLIKAGKRLYAAGGGKITAIDLTNPSSPAVAWTLPVDGAVERLVAAADRLFAVTREGQILAFGAEKKQTQHIPYAPAKVQPPEVIAKHAEDILNRTGVRDGYAVVYGAAEPALLEAFASASDLRIVALQDDAEDVDASRRKLDAEALYGTRVAVHKGDILSFRVPPYMASLSVIDNPEMAGFEFSAACLKRLFEPIRPYGGALWLPLKGADQNKFKDLVTSCALPGAAVKTFDDGVLLTREGPLPGSAYWTHQYGNSANTVKSDDDLVKMPLGILWFGGSPNTDVLPRHGHGPSPQVIGGRLIIEGMDCISARDVYTGRVLWKTVLGDLGTFDVYYDKTYKDTPTSTAYNQVHIPGANIRGSNYVATLDKVYILQGSDCVVLDSATGERLGAFKTPDKRKSDERSWGYIGISGDTLVGTAGFVPISGIPIKGDMDTRERKAYREFQRFDKSGSRELVVMDRHSGEVRWTREAKHGFLHNAIALSKDTLFCLDKMPPFVEQFMRRRGKSSPRGFRLYAIDLQTGKVKWEQEENIFGSWLGYSEEHNVLLQATRPSSDTVGGEDGRRMIVYSADDGKVLWDVERGYNNPPILHGDHIITHGKMYDMLTGEPVMRTNPLTGDAVPWTYQRTKGCNYHIASEHLLTFRSSAAAYFDLDSDGGTGHFGGFKSGCSNNLIAADGLLNAPDYTRTCSCAYQNQTSLALIHMPEVEVWTTCPTLEVKAPVQRIGVNLGASGDRKAENGTLWLEYPVVGGESPQVAIRAGDGAQLLVRRGAEWKYLDNGSDQGAAWREPAFDDSAWASGPAELGYGDGDEATVVSFGDAKDKKHITTYFRRTFDVPEKLVNAELEMNVKLDDGAVVYLNGREVFRKNMPNGDIKFDTLSSGGDSWENTPVAPGALVAGANVLAAEMHQSSLGSSDISFDLELRAEAKAKSKVEWLHCHSSRMQGKGPRWIGASGAEGLPDLEIALAPNGTEERPYTVRLFFAELRDLAAGQRLFSVRLQGKEVLKDLDIASETGGTHRTLVKEFRGVRVSDVLRIAMTPKAGAPIPLPLLCGVEAVAETGPLSDTAHLAKAEALR